MRKVSLAAWSNQRVLWALGKRRRTFLGRGEPPGGVKNVFFARRCRLIRDICTSRTVVDMVFWFGSMVWIYGLHNTVVEGVLDMIAWRCIYDPSCKFITQCASLRILLDSDV